MRFHQIQHHLEACAELGRPMLVGEFNAMKPYKRRNDFIKVVHEELLNGVNLGYPVAGELHSIGAYQQKIASALVLSGQALNLINGS